MCVWDAHVSSPPAPKLPGISPQQPSLSLRSYLIQHCSLASVKPTAQIHARAHVSRQNLSLAFGEFAFLGENTEVPLIPPLPKTAFALCYTLNTENRIYSKRGELMLKSEFK